MFKPLPIILLSICPIHLFAVTYYVSPSGNDGNNGLSSSSAFRTLQHASDVVTAGDSVIVMAGTYTGFYQSTSGTISSPIVFSAQPGVTINQPNDITDDGINLEGASYIIVEGFRVYGVPRTGIRSVDNSGVIIRNNVTDSCGVWGILTGFSENILIEDNECSRSVEQHGIYFGNSADNPVIRGNLCWGNHDAGIHMNGDASLGGDGIISNALVENNILYDNGPGGGSAINCDGVQNSVIQNNLMYNNHASGISLYRIDAGGGANNNLVVNNTILQASDARWALNISDGSINNIVFNNIFYSAHAFRGSVSIDQASLPGFHCNYNIQTDRMSTDGGSTVITLAQWQQTTHLDSSSLIAAPVDLFLNVATDDYHLSQNSAAIDLGRNSYCSGEISSTDLEGHPRVQGAAPDAGAYEYGTLIGIQEISASAISSILTAEDQVFLFDLSGRLLLEGKLNAVEERIKLLSTGTYFLVARSKLPPYLQCKEMMVVK